MSKKKTPQTPAKAVTTIDETSKGSRSLVERQPESRPTP